MPESEDLQAKKLKSESRAETIKLLASLAPATSTSSGLLSSSSLGQNPLNPTSALQRKEQLEDRLVRRGIDVLRNRHGSEDISSDEGMEGREEISSRVEKRKAKGKERETVQDASVLDGVLESTGSLGSAGATLQNGSRSKKKPKRSKAVSRT